MDFANLCENSVLANFDYDLSSQNSQRLTLFRERSKAINGIASPVNRPPVIGRRVAQVQLGCLGEL